MSMVGGVWDLFVYFLLNFTVHHTYMLINF